MDKSNQSKLDVGRTLKIGIAFMSIMCFWEVYDYIMPLILQRYFGLTNSQYGVVMGVDNLLAIFLLPMFGAFSDKANKTKLGRRTSFFVWGLVISVVLIVIMAIIENVQYNQLLALNINDIGALKEFGLDDKFFGQDYVAISAMPKADMTKEQFEMFAEYSKAVLSAQQNMASSVTQSNPWIFVGFIFVLCSLLVSMASFRSPVVALMPDITPKPYRSQANAIINFVGGIGVVVAIAIYKILAKNRYQSHIALFVTLGVVMLIMMIVYLLTVNEKKLVQLRELEEKSWGIYENEHIGGQEKLSKPMQKSLLLILFTVFFWFMGFNAVKTHLSTYATKILNFDDGFVGTISLMSTVGGAIALLPVALIASRIGRKKTIIIGLIIALISFVPCFFLEATTPLVKVIFPICFVVAGFGLITINVNTFPMVTELAKNSNVGKYTGYYYVFSMTAQAVTPYISGIFMDNIQEKYLFAYSVFMIAVAMLTTMLIKHGDNKPMKKQSKLEYFSDEE